MDSQDQALKHWLVANRPNVWQSTYMFYELDQLHNSGVRRVRVRYNSSHFKGQGDLPHIKPTSLQPRLIPKILGAFLLYGPPNFQRTRPNSPIR